MKVTKEYINQLIKEEIDDVINRDPKSPREKLIELLDECADALHTTSEEYLNDGYLDIGEHYLNLTKRCLSASDFLKTLHFHRK